MRDGHDPADLRGDERQTRRPGACIALGRPIGALAGHRAIGALARRPWLLAWLAFLPVALARAGTLAESDTFWEIRTGLITISHRAIPATDSFSWTAHGRPWTVNSWGFNVLLAAAYRVAGLPGVALAGMVLVMAIVAVLLVLARQLGATPAVAAAVLLVVSPLLVAWLSARPQLIDYIALPVLVLLLRGIAAGHPPARRVLAVGLVSVAWVNVHSAALLGVAVCAASAVALLLRPRARTAGLWCLAATVAALVGSFVNPYGVGVIAQTVQVQADSAGLIIEWQHVNLASPVQDLMLLVGLAALVLLWRRRELVLAATLVVVLAGSLNAIRLLPFVVIVAVPVLASGASRPPPALLRYARSRRLMLLQCGTLGLLALAVVAAPNLTHVGRPSHALYPVSIAGDIPSGCQVFTSDLLGSFLILARPDVSVSLDTRNTLYGRQQLLADERVLAGHGSLARGLAGAGCVLVTPASGLARRLNTDPAWRRIAVDPPAAALFVRSS